MGDYDDYYSGWGMGFHLPTLPGVGESGKNSSSMRLKKAKARKKKKAAKRRSRS